MDKTKQIERLGINAVEAVCIKLGWCFREQPVLDYGVDAIVELIDKDRNSLNLIALQIKSGKSYFAEKNGDNIIFRFEESHKRYWETYQIPVVIVLFNPNDKLLICQTYNEKSIEKCATGYKMPVDIRSSFEAFLATEAKEIRKIPEHIYNFNYMLSQLPFMQKIKDGYDVILNSEEWVNKSSGRGSISIEIIKGKDREEYQWRYWFPFQMYPFVFAKLFPWADFEADEIFLHGEEVYSAEGLLDSINESRLARGDALLSFGASDECIDHIKGILRAGEVAFYKLHLSINEFGEAFYLTYHELMNMKPYKGLIISKK